MPKVHITFSTGNDAFTDGAGPSEVARILRELTEVAEEGNGAAGAIIDVNGSKIGTYSIKYPD